MEEEFVRDELDEWVAEHMDEFVRNYRGNYLVLVGKEVMAVAKDELAAWGDVGEVPLDQEPCLLYIPKKSEESLLL
ncbi:MAG: hypothetical protein H8E90_01805 [Anaerolineales bacterium]|nr:hypothetical protein [Anaerolineales bacterium]